MDQQAALAFFSTFYTNTSLYVVEEPATELLAPVAPVVAAAVPPIVPLPVVATPQPSPVATVAAPTPKPTPPVVPPAPSKLPSLAGLNLQSSPTPAPKQAPEPSPVPTPPPAPVPSAPRQPTATSSPVASTPFSTLGSNPNGLIILVRLDPVRFQRLPKNVFLNNVLKAIRLIVEDVVLINVESHLPVALSTLRQTLAAKQIIGFGKNLLDVAVYKTQLYEPVLLVNDVAYLPAAEIELIEEDNSRKKLLWQAMQRMFLR
ncbi:hypothetical protein [Hymenobacter crusticola]|uniref:Uncharacterized protein n=1 Tax=Hymenobacter crusticola TaxID=1770526 RepID=A0A243WGL5_9BACT|nr:hypothetical protein [Hymenobacter crusticola]OUJ74891.1 hypothetical protein BXP70_09090 [Hymenobacter crusticola]